MQVISRGVNEGLVIGDDVFVTVLDVQENEVRLGISAPNNDPSYWEQTLSWTPVDSTQQLQLQ